VSPNSLIRTPRQLLVLFLTLTILPATALVWLGWTLQEQDRILENSRIQERRERAADLIVAALQQSIAVVEQRLTDASAARTLGAPDGQVVVLSPQGIETIPPRRLLYYPMRPSLPEASPELFESGENDEFRSQNHAGAIAKFRELTRFPDAAVRAGALLRMARNLRKAGRSSEALDVYSELAGYDRVAIGGLPAGLVAQQARCAVLAGLKKTGDLRREAAQFEMDLRRGRWQLDRAAYVHYATEIATWLSTDPEREPPESGEAHLAGIVDSLWARWDISKRDDAPATGREVIPSGNETGIMVWHSSPERLAALIVDSSYIEREWMSRLRPLLENQGLSVALEDSGKRSDGGFTTVRTAPDSGLPWKLVVETADPTADLAQSAARRRLMLAGLTLLLMVVLAGSYFVAKSVTRELAVAALQSDFVAAVSHEFRTPLTALRQVTEILADGRVAEPSRAPLAVCTGWWNRYSILAAWKPARSRIACRS
jgi:hypothetical protein